MEYITATKHYPGAFSDTEARLLRTVGQAGHWLPDPRCLRFVELEALEFLRYVGYIEKASFGGYRVKGRTAAPPPSPAHTGGDVRALLASVGVQVDRIRYIGDTKGEYARPGVGRQVTVVFQSTIRLAGADLSAFATDVIVNDNILVMRLKEVA